MWRDRRSDRSGRCSQEPRSNAGRRTTPRYPACSPGSEARPAIPPPSGTRATITMLKMPIDPTMPIKTNDQTTKLPKKSQTLWMILRDFANLRVIFAPMVRCEREFGQSCSASLRPLRSRCLFLEIKASTRGGQPRAATRARVRHSDDRGSAQRDVKNEGTSLWLTQNKGDTKFHIVQIRVLAKLPARENPGSALRARHASFARCRRRACYSGSRGALLAALWRRYE